MKPFVRFGVLGVFIALAAALGVVHSFTVTTTVDAQIPGSVSVVKNCGTTTLAIGANTQCNVVITNTSGAAITVPGPITLSVAPANATGYGQVQLLNGVSGATGTDVNTVVVVNPITGAQSIVVSCFTGPAACTLAPGAAGAITIVEGAIGAVGGPTTESIDFGANAPAQITPNVTVQPATTTLFAQQVNLVACTPQTIVAGSGAGGAVTCNIDLDDNDLVNPNAVSSGTVTLTLTNPPAGLVFQTTGTTTATFRCQTAGANEPQGCNNFNFVLVSQAGGALGAAGVQVSYQPDLTAVNTPIVNQIVPSIITVVAQTATGLAAKNCTATGLTVNCTLTVTLGSAAAGGATIAVTKSGNASFSTTTPPTVTSTTCMAMGNIATPTITSPSANGFTITFAAGGCQVGGQVVISETLNVTVPGGGLLTQTLSGAGGFTPPVTVPVPGFPLPANSGFTQPAALRITCTSALAGPFAQPIPGPIGNVNVLAIGVLPASLPCQVVGLDAAGNQLTAFAAGTIEVTSLNGTLLDANGQLTTNLRIGCDNPGAVGAGQTAPVNTCQGVTFSVLGLGVGFVDLRARYEPSTVAAAAGITEVEATGSVGFVAPAVTVNLLLSPNPVVVGQTGTATARFNRTFNCALAFGQNVQGGTVCIDPTTGLPIAFNFGSGLNGSVVFTIDNTAIASWADAVTSTPVALPQVSGFTATASQVIKRCGFFPTTGAPAFAVPGLQPFGPVAGPLANFFGGCDSADARYKGNVPGVAQVTATFVPDLPGAFGTNLVGLTQPVTGLLGLFGATSQPFQTRTLEVVAAAPVGTVQLARGCNNVSPTVSEAASAYAARVTPAGALVAIWEHQAATNTFRGFSPMAGAPNDLASVTRLRPVFVCVSAAATLDQPPA